MNYYDRNGKTYVCSDKQDRLLKDFYGNIFGRALIRLAMSRPVTSLIRLYLNSPLSKRMIPSFIKENGIDMSQYESRDYGSFNSFFIRRIKKENRPIDKEANVLISPCDSKLSIYRIDGDNTFTIKNSVYTLEALTKSKKIAARYEGGYALIFRLTADDYHHYCYVDDGLKGRSRYIRGEFHTVNPIAQHYVPVYSRNSREYCILRSKHFGDILVMEVGALFVGHIVNYHDMAAVKKGEEKGYFEFGGSTIILLLQKHRVDIDKDLLSITSDGGEVLVKMGERIGVATDGTNHNRKDG